MSAPPVLCAAVEVALNRYLGLEPDALARCGQWSGRCIALHAIGPAWQFNVEFHGGGVRVLADCEHEPDVTVSGPLGTLMRLAWTGMQGEPEGALPQGLTVDGDIELLRQFNRLLGSVGFDPEEFAARFLGDAAAHRAVSGLRSLLGWGRRTADTLGLDTAEYLREETRDLARAADVEDWMRAVERVRDDTERLEARIRRIEAGAGS